MKETRMSGTSSSSMRRQLESYASLKGQQVKEDANKDEWFIVKVTNFDRETKEFKLLDKELGDDEEGGGQR